MRACRVFVSVVSLLRRLQHSLTGVRRGKHWRLVPRGMGLRFCRSGSKLLVFFVLSFVPLFFLFFEFELWLDSRFKPRRVGGGGVAAQSPVDSQ